MTRGKLKKSARAARSRGFTMLYVFFALGAMMALASLAVDWGRVQLTKTELQRAADAGARAGASQLSSGVSAVQTAAVLFSGDNNADSAQVVIDPIEDVDFGTWDNVARTFTVLTGSDRTSANSVRVTARRTTSRGNAVPLVFGAAVGVRTCDTAAASTVFVSTSTLDYSAGFTGVSTLSQNGTAIAGSVLRLTTATTNLGTSAWNTARVPVEAFTTTFSLQITSPAADGCTFAIQNNLTTSKGGAGGALGYQGISNSVAVKFDIYSNSGEGTTSTGVYVGGAAPYAVGSFDTTSSGVNLRSGHVMNVSLVYDGTTLTQTITDATTAAVFTHAYTVNIPAAVGGSAAYVGFTGGTGGSTAIQDVQKWTYIASGALSMVK